MVRPGKEKKEGSGRKGEVGWTPQFLDVAVPLLAYRELRFENDIVNQSG